MPLGDTGISVTAVRNESQQGNTNYVSGLTTSSQVNPYSFWSPRGVVFDSADSFFLKPVTDASPYQLGDFRRYNHAAQTPRLRATPNINYSLDPGSTTTYVPIWYDNYEFNFKRADSASQIVKFGLRYFTSLADAKANINAISLVGGSTTVYQNITFDNRTVRDSFTPSPALSGHVVTQTTIPNSSSILVNSNTTAFPTTGLTTTAVTRFMRLDFYDTANAIKGRLPNYVSGSGATNTGTLVTVASTTGLFANMALEVTAGTGAFPTGAYVVSVDSATQFTASAAPSPSLSAGAVVTAYPIMPFTVRVKADPVLTFQTQTPIPSGFTAVFVDTFVTSDNTQAMALGDNILRARIRVRGIQGVTNDYVLGTLSMKYWDGTTETTMTGYQNVSFTKSDGTTYSLAVTWTMPSGRTWSYDSSHTVRVTFNTASFT